MDLDKDLTAKNIINFENEIIYVLLEQSEYRSLILSKINVDDFELENNRIIFKTIKEFVDNNFDVDASSIFIKLSSEDYDEETINNLKYHLNANVLSCGYVDNIDSKIEILINNSAKKKTDQLAKKIINTKLNLLDPDPTFFDWTSMMDKIINSRNIGDVELIKVSAEKYLNKILESTRAHGELTGVTSGYKDIDDFTNGFQKGDLIILAARPSIGKTALAINFMINLAKELHDEKDAIVFFSLEMSKEQIIQRMVANLAEIDGNILRNGQIDDFIRKKIYKSVNEIKDYKIFIEDKPNMTILDIESRLRQIAQNHEIKLVVVDYLQLIESTNHSQNRVLEVGKISRKLKIMARELNIPLIAIAQLSRKIEERKAEEKRPMLSDLRESGSIEQDADIVTFIDYDRNQIDPLSSTTGSTKTLSRVEVVFYIEKHRNGRTGTVKLWFSKNEGRFINHT